MMLNFIKNLIEDYKFNDTKDILQEDYEEYNITNSLDISNNIINIGNIGNIGNITGNITGNNLDIDNILLKEEKKNNKYR